MEQKADLSPVTIAKPRFVLGNMLFISLLLLGGHVGLVKLYPLGQDLTTITGAILTTVIISMLVWQNEDRFSPLIVGVLIWAVLGEVVEQLGFGSIVRVRNFVLLSPPSCSYATWPAGSICRTS